MLFGKKKKKLAVPELPPPPSPPGLEKPIGDIPPITPSPLPEPSLELPELPAAPGFEHEEPGTIELPEPPAPEIPQPEEIAAPIVPEPMEEIHEAPVFERETVRKPVGPAFVSVDEYRTIMDSSNRVRAKLSEAEEFMHRLEEIKSEEDKLFDKWRAQLEDVERKLGNIDRVIAKAKR